VRLTEEKAVARDLHLTKESFQLDALLIQSRDSQVWTSRARAKRSVKFILISTIFEKKKSHRKRFNSWHVIPPSLYKKGKNHNSYILPEK
jgi:hypothetical protein